MEKWGEFSGIPYFVDVKGRVPIPPDMEDVYIAGLNPHIGVVVNGWSGWETRVRRRLIEGEYCIVHNGHVQRNHND